MTAAAGTACCPAPVAFDVESPVEVGGRRFGCGTAAAAAGNAVSAWFGEAKEAALLSRTLESQSPGTSTTPVAATVLSPSRKKVRIVAFDSLRFLLVTYIVIGHFIGMSSPSLFVWRAFTQINVMVGAFFALSGYVAAYTNTENAAHEPSAKLLETPKTLWILQKVSTYYPLHVFFLVIFSPIFIYPDVYFNGWATAAANGLLAVTLTQAWFPMHAEVWNAPAWFLSALTFATVALPFALPIFARQTKAQLRRSLAFLFLVGLLPKLGYCYDLDGWGLLEGAMNPKDHPNLLSWNMQRFSPWYATVEVLLGAAACRLVMLDGAPDEEQAPKSSCFSVLAPAITMPVVIILRATGVLQVSDLLTRAIIIIPLFLRLLMAAHRASIRPEVTDLCCKLLRSQPLVALGNLTFPVFLIHGPIGQLFFKRVIGNAVFGGPLQVVLGPWFFYVYLAITLVAAWAVQNTFLSSKAVAKVSKRTCEGLAWLLQAPRSLATPAT